MPPNILRVHTAYVLVKQWVRKSCGLNHESPPVQWQNCGGGDRWCRHLSSLRGISPSKFVLSPAWCSRPRPTTGVLLAFCHDEFRGPHSDYVRQVALVTKGINTKGRHLATNL
ncbi:uncharacterized protein TNCV_4153991 [Trichonephila clavipes]|nr:uncharacterized protein TNCV_4153991 [Trichonephila clavipes]